MSRPKLLSYSCLSVVVCLSVMLLAPFASDGLAQSALPGQPTEQNLTQRPLLGGTINGVRWALFAPGHDSSRTRGQGTLSITAPPDAEGVYAKYDASSRTGVLQYRSRGTLRQLLDMHDEQLKRQGFAPKERRITSRSGSITYTRGKGRLTLLVAVAGGAYQASLRLGEVRPVPAPTSMPAAPDEKPRSP